MIAPPLGTESEGRLQVRDANQASLVSISLNDEGMSITYWFLRESDRTAAADTDS